MVARGQGRGRRIAVLALLAASLGCFRERSNQDFYPPTDRAEKALAAVLRAWQSGDTSDELADGESLYRLVDSRRDKGVALEGFEIIGEVPGERGRWFEVDLQAADGGTVQRVKYAVVGIRPLWIFRQEDYDMLSHWDHTMPVVKKKESR